MKQATPVCVSVAPSCGSTKKKKKKKIGHSQNPDQAGFIRGRSIFDQIDQTVTAINDARPKGINRAIAALDQEKAYDKIVHPYLWKILETFAFPEGMINLVKVL